MFDRIFRPEQILTALPEAMRVLTDPAETGTVTICLPQDVQPEAYDYPVHFFAERNWTIERQLPSPGRIEQAVALLKSAQRPMIIAGGGVIFSEASTELEELSQLCGIPVAETKAGKGAHTKPSDWLLHGHGTNRNPAAAKVAREADLVLCVGTRLTDFETGSQSAFQHPDVGFISINVGGHDAYKQGSVPILADAREGPRALIHAAQQAGISLKDDYRQEIASLCQGWAAQCQSEIFSHSGGVMIQGQLILTMNEEAQPGDTVVAAAGSPPGDLHKLWDATDGRNCHIEFGYSYIGYEIPVGIGVRMAQPDGEVIVYIGDGTYLMNPTELVTAIQEGLKVTVVITETDGYQCIRALQEFRAGHPFGNEFRCRDTTTNRLDGEYVSIDFAKNAESFGAKTWNVDTKVELRDALRAARKQDGLCVIVVKTARDIVLPGSGMFWDFSVAAASNDELTNKLRTEYEEDRQVQRFYY